MVYLTQTSAALGAIRLLPASHTVEAQRRLRRLQAFHGVLTASQRWMDGTFGVAGEELPAKAVEIREGSGDQVFFSSQCYHAVYHHQPGRRVVAHNFCARHRSDAVR